MRDNRIDFDGLHFVESLHDEKFVMYVEHLENERLDAIEDEDEEDISSEEEPEAVLGKFVLTSKTRVDIMNIYIIYQNNAALYVKPKSRLSFTTNAAI